MCVLGRQGVTCDINEWWCGWRRVEGVEGAKV